MIHLRGGGEEGVGEDVVYTVVDHFSHRDAGPVLIDRFREVSTFGEFCDLLGELDLFNGIAPEMEASRNYRRWAYESAALDLALRQAGTSLHERLGIEPRPVRFVCSTRLSTFEDDSASSLEPVTKRLEKHPTLEFKLDPENDWTPELIDELKKVATVRVLDLKGHYKNTPVDVETDPDLYRRVAEAFPEAWIEDADLDHPGAREALEPYLDRLSWDAPLHSLDDILALERQPKAINSKPSRFGSMREILAVYEFCVENGITVYAGGQGEFEPGRGQAQYLASLFHPDSTNDIAPSVYNDPSVPDGMPDSPLTPSPAPTGFRWFG